MAAEYNTFVGSSCSIGEVVACVEELIGHQLRPVDTFGETEYEGSVLGILVSVAPEIGFLDYGGMDFTNYSVCITFRSSAGSEISKRRVEVARSLALLCAAILSIDYGYDCMAVKEVDILIEKFPGRGGNR